jgi:hypothetical protein
MHFITGWIGSYLLPALFSYLFLAVAIMVADRYVGVHLYRWYYNRGNEPADRMPDTVTKGWLYDQPLRRQHNRAMVISAVVSGLTLMVGTFTTWEKFAELVALVFEGWVMLPGFKLGELLYDKVLVRQDQIFQALDNRHELASGLFDRLKALLPKAAAPAPHPEASTAHEVAAHTPQQPPRSMSAKDILQRQADGRKL